jgi:hypothetical protein
MSMPVTEEYNQSFTLSPGMNYTPHTITHTHTHTHTHTRQEIQKSEPGLCSIMHRRKRGVELLKSHTPSGVCMEWFLECQETPQRCEARARIRQAARTTVRTETRQQGWPWSLLWMWLTDEGPTGVQGGMGSWVGLEMSSLDTQEWACCAGGVPWWAG